MANLTGEYDLAIEAGMGLVNAILGAVHQNQDTRFPVMPHSLSLFLDDASRGPGDPVPESSRTGIRSRVEVQVSTPIVSLPVDVLQVRPESLHGPGTRHVGFGAGSRSAARALGDIFVPPFRRVPRLQAKLRIRAWVRDATDGRLPEFLHGDLFVTTGLVRSEVAGVGTFVTLDRSSALQVAFSPAFGTTVTDEQRQLVARIVSNVIRADMEPPTFEVSLPSEITQFDFKLLNEARRPAIQLLFGLSGRTAGPGARDGVPGGLLPDGADFSVAVGRDFVLGIVESSLAGAIEDSYGYSTFGISATVQLDRPRFELEPGRMVLTVTGEGDVKVEGLSPVQDHFTLSVRQAFGLRVAGGGLEPFADGDPVVSLEDIAAGGDFIEGRIRDTVKQERDAALAEGAAQFRDAVDVGGQLETILGGISPLPSGVSLTGVQIRADGILVTGSVALAASGPVAVTQVVRAGFHDALESWIPGGTIDRLIWEPFGPASVTGARVDDHRFVTEGGGPLISIFDTFCLRVEGTRVAAGGALVPVSGSDCSVVAPVIGPVDGVSDRSDRPLLPLTFAGDGELRVVGHFDPWASGRAPSGGHPNRLLFFGDPGAAGEVRAGLAAARTDTPAVLPIAVVPSEGGRGPASSGDMLTIVDHDGRWAEGLGVSDGTACVLVGPRGDVLWRETEVTAKSVARALKKHATEGGGAAGTEVAGMQIRLGSVRVGERPPDVPLRLPEGGVLSLRRLRGRAVVLAFFTSRSEPSLDHLEFLRDLRASAGADAPLVVAVGDGEQPERVAEIAEERRLEFLVLPDTDRLVSRTVGVWCWPATVWIRADGMVEGVDFGAAVPSPGPSPGSVSA